MQKNTSQSRLARDTKEEKRHYKLYKKGRLWLTAGVSLLFSGMVLTAKTTVYADTNVSAGDKAAATADASAIAGERVTLRSSQAAATQTDTATATSAPEATTQAKVSAFDGIAATVEDDAKPVDDATTAPTVYAVKLADGLTQPVWTAADFDTTGVDSQVAGQYAITLSAAGIAKLQATNPTYTFAATNVQAGHLTITAATGEAADTTTATDTATATEATATTSTADKTADTDATTDTPAAVTDTTSDVAGDTYSDATADTLAQGATKTAAQMATYRQQAAALADASTTDAIVNNDALNALQEHQVAEKQQVLDLTSAAKVAAPTDTAAALAQLAQAAQILNTMNLELTQAATMVRDDRKGAATNVEAIAQAALDQLNLPAGTSGKTDAYGDLIIAAPDQASYQAAVDAVKAQGLLKDFREVVDPETEGIEVTGATTEHLIVNVDRDKKVRATSVDGDAFGQILKAKALVEIGDKITVSFSGKFDDLTSDDLMGVQKTVENGVTTFTFTADTQGDTFINFDWTTIQIADADALAKDSVTSTVTLSVNGTQVASQDFVATVSRLFDTVEINNDSINLAPSISIDRNQEATLKVGEEYAFGVAANPDAKGWSQNANTVTGTIVVPDGFILDGAIALDSESQHGIRYSTPSSIVGDELGSADWVPSSLGTVATQAGGAGTPISFAATSNSYGPESTSSDGIFYFWGHYTEEVSAADNTMSVTFDDGEAHSIVNMKGTDSIIRTEEGTHQIIGGTTTQNFGKNVSVSDSDTRAEAVQQIYLANVSTSTFMYGDAVIKDEIQADGTLKSEDDSYYPSNAPKSGPEHARNWEANYLNSGNVAQTNVTETVSAPGLIQGKATILAFGTLNMPDTITFTATDGTTYTQDVSALENGTFSLPEGEVYDSFVAHYPVVLPGTGVVISFANTYLQTDLPAGSDYTFTNTTTSDQLPDPDKTEKTVKIVDPISKPYSVDINTTYNANVQGNVRPDDPLVQPLYLSPNISNRPFGVYYYDVPTSATLDLVQSTFNGKSLSLYATDLGAVGVNGSQVYKFDFSTVMGSQANAESNLGAALNLIFKVNTDALPGPSGSGVDALFANLQQEAADYFTGVTVKTEATIGTQTFESDAIKGGSLNFNVLIPEFYGAKNGIDAPQTTADHTYLLYDETQGGQSVDNPTIAVFSRGATDSTDDDLNATTLRMTTINTTKISPTWTQNVITLPSKADGTVFTLNLTGPGILATTSPENSNVLYSTQTYDLTVDKLDESTFMTAKQVTDWDTIRTVMLRTDALPEGATAVATLPIAVADINTVPDPTLVPFDSVLLGDDKDGVTTHNTATMGAIVERTQILTTQWLQENADGTTTAIVPSTTQNLHIGDEYATAPLTATEIPDHYALVVTPTNASGTVGEDPITVTYRYAYQQQKAVVNYVDDDADGAILYTDNAKTEAGLAGDTFAKFDYSVDYTKEMATLTAEGYELVPSKAADALPAGNIITFDKDDATDQTYTVHLKHTTDTAVETFNVTQRIQYVYAKGSKVAADKINTVTFTANKTTDAFVEAAIAQAKATITDPDELATTLATLGDATTYSDWKASKAGATYGETYKFIQVADPQVTGYTNDHPADQQYVPAMTVDPTQNGLADILLTVTYTAIPQTAVVKYVDDDAADQTPIHTDTLAGATTETSNYSAQYDTETATLEAAGYVIGANDFGKDQFSDAATKVITFDAVTDPTSGDPTQVYTVHLHHKTVPVTDTNTVAETITYTFDTADGKQAADPFDTSTTFTRTGTTDLVAQAAAQTDDNGTTWSAWDPVAHAFNAVTSPHIDGYTANITEIATQTVDAGDDDLAFHVIYTADDQQAVVNYVDDDHQEAIVYTDDSATIAGLAGKSDGQFSYADAYTAETEQLVATGYTVGSDDLPATQLITFDHDSAKAQVYTVHLHHAVKPATSDLTDSVQETITYVYAKDNATAAPTVTKTIDFSRTGTVDQVTGETTYTDWVADNGDATFVKVDSPKITGYTADLTQVNAKTVVAGDDDYSVTVKYTADEQKGSVTYVDDDAASKALKTEGVSGGSDTTYDYGTQYTTATTAFEAAGYIVGKDDLPNKKVITFDDDTAKDQDYTVHLSHKQEDVTEPTQLSDTVNETINYIFEDGTTAAPAASDQVTFTRTGATDAITGETTYTPWVATAGKDTFKAATSPTVTGFTPDTATVAEQSVKAGDDDVVINVTYRADLQKAIVNYVDDAQEQLTLKTASFTGGTKTDYDYSADYTSATTTFIGQGYTVVGSDLPTGNVVTFDTDDDHDQVFTVHLTHATTPITDPAALTQTVTDTIHYVFDDGKKAADDHQETLTFTRTGVSDAVTGTATYTPWTAADASFEAVANPVIAGYFTATYGVGAVAEVQATAADLETTEVYHALGHWVPNLPQVPEQQYPGDPNDPTQPEAPETPDYPTIPYVPGYTPSDPNGDPLIPVDPDTPNKGYVPPVLPVDPGTDTPIIYTADNQQALVTYIDDTADKTLTQVKLDGTTGSTSAYRTATAISDYQAQGYVLVSNDYPDTGVVFDNDSDHLQAFEVHLRHDIVPVTETTQLTETVTETIHYRYAKDNSTAVADKVQTLDFARTGTTDKVTGQATFTAWTTADDTFEQVDNPPIAGYTTATKGIGAVPNVRATDADIDTTVYYNADVQQGSVTYIDDTTQSQLKQDALSGRSGSRSAYRTTDTIAAYAEQGYTLVADNYPVSGVIFDTDATTDQNFAVHLQHAIVPVTAPAALTATVTETIHYVYAKDGTTAAPDAVQTLTFVRTGAVDSVTKATTYTAWTTADNDFDQVRNPVIAGYSTATTGVGAVLNVDGDDADLVTTITYNRDAQRGSVTYIDDTTGATLATDALVGKSGERSDYRTTAKIAGYALQGYQLISDDYPTNGVQFDTDDAVDQNFTVHLLEKTDTYTPENPGTPGDPTDPKNPDGPKTPQGADKDSLVRVVTETVHYVYEDGTKAFDDHDDQVEFQQTMTFNEVTGAITTTPWVATADDTTFDGVDSPELAGYLADKASVAAVTGLTQDSANVEETVTYKALGNWVPNLPEVPETPYPNDPNDPSQPADPSAPHYPTIPYVPGYTPNDPSGDPLEPVDPDTPQKGYVPPVLPVDPGTDTPITYTSDDQLLNVVYLDTTTHQWLATDHDHGASGTKSAYTTASKIAAYLTDGYALISDGYPAGGATFDHDDLVAQTFVVNLAHRTKTATPEEPGVPGTPIEPENPEGPQWPDGADKDTLTKTVNEVVHYVYTDGTQAAPDHTDHVTFVRTATIDEVTGAMTHSDWTAVDNDTTFDAVNSPVLSGYLADKDTVAEVAGLTATSDDVDETVTYAKIGSFVPNIPDAPSTPYPNDPEDPSQPEDPSTPGYPTIPDVPGYTPYGPDGSPLTPVDPDNPEAGYTPPVLPDDPTTDTPITYVPNTDEPDDDTSPRVPLPDTDAETPDEPMTPALPTDTPQTPASTTPVTQTNGGETDSSRRKLPQTGDRDQNWLAVAGLSIMAALGLSRIKRREDDK